MNTLSMKPRFKLFHIIKSVWTSRQKINSSHHTIKTYAETSERQNQKRMTAFEWLFLSNSLLELNDFGDTIIK